MENLLHNVEMFITKSTMQDGLMKWSAVNSDTGKDLYGERMTLELYRKMLSYIRDGVPPPEDFKPMVCSEYWCGGMPYLSIAHYSDLNGKAVPGQPLELFIDGSQLKAKGIIFDTPLGKAVWSQLKQDEIKIKSGADDERIRISIAFLDLAHKHGESGKVFERKSITSVCQECAKGKGEKIYVDGYLVHLALTTVPVNPRTIMTPEDIMARKSVTTKKEDALSVVGDEALVEEITKSALEAKSDVLVEMSDTEAPIVEEAKTKKDVEEISAKDEQEADSEDDLDDGGKPKDKKKKAMAKSSLTEEDIEVIRNLIVETMPKGVEVVPIPVIEPVAQKSALDIATDELYNSIDGAIKMQSVTIEQRLDAINPALANLGNAITSLVKESVGVVAPATVSNDQSLVLEAITSLSNSVTELAQKIAIVEEKSKTPSEAPVQSRIPAPRSIQPVVSQSQTSAPANPNSVANIVRRSVSQSLPLK